MIGDYQHKYIHENSKQKCKIPKENQILIVFNVGGVILSKSMRLFSEFKYISTASPAEIPEAGIRTSSEIFVKSA